jgi:hypothetical protein
MESTDCELAPDGHSTVLNDTGLRKYIAEYVRFVTQVCIIKGWHLSEILMSHQKHLQNRVHSRKLALALREAARDTEQPETLPVDRETPPPDREEDILDLVELFLSGHSI